MSSKVIQAFWINLGFDKASASDSHTDLETNSNPSSYTELTATFKGQKPRIRGLRLCLQIQTIFSKRSSGFSVRGHTGLDYSRLCTLCIERTSGLWFSIRALPGLLVGAHSGSSSLPANQGHFTHKTEGPWPLQSKSSHWSKGRRPSKFQVPASLIPGLHKNVFSGFRKERKMDVLQTSSILYV
jgi:hypothetical protein